MAEQAKTAPATQEHPYPPPSLVPYPQQVYNGAPYPPPGPPGAYMPPMFAYPPPPDGSHPEGAQHGVPPAPYMIGLPPGLVYAYPPHPQAQAFGPPPTNSSAPPALTRPKRKQVKMACTNCANACKRCDESRPCERCVKYGIADTCVDGQRKERKKGIKRGPYKRKVKGENEPANFNGEWQNGSPTAATSAPPVHPGYPEGGFYPVFYPPPGFIPPPPHEGQPGPDGSPPHANGQPPLMPYYIHPGLYPPFPHHPPMYPPGVAPQPTPVPGGSAPPPPTASSSSSSQSDQTSVGGAHPEQPQTVNPSDTARKADEGAPSERNGAEAPVAVGKKRSRTTKTGEPKAKKAKAGTAVNGHDTSAAATASAPAVPPAIPVGLVSVAPGAEEKKDSDMTITAPPAPAATITTIIGHAAEQQSGTANEVPTNANAIVDDNAKST